MRSITQRVVGAAALFSLLSCGLTAYAAELPFSCTTSRGTWSVVASQPILVECPAGGDCTQIDYAITSLKGTSLKPDYIAVLVESDMKVVNPSPTNVIEACKGDPITELGRRDCSSQSVHLVKNLTTTLFPLAVEGSHGPLAASIVVKKGTSIEQCRIASLGRDTFDVNAQVSTAQQFTFKGCTVAIPTDSATGEGGPASISGPGCAFVANAEPVANGELLINGQSVGALSYGDGSISSGVASCTTRVISRKLYTWCTCADVTGDGIPDDPRPPCPNSVTPSFKAE